MADERVESWVREKLDRGIDPERIRNSLREEGYDPSIVDEVRGTEETTIDLDREPPSPEEEPQEPQDTEVSEDSAQEGLRDEFSMPSLNVSDRVDISGKEAAVEQMAGNVERDLVENWKRGAEVMAVALLLAGSMLVMPHLDLSFPEKLPATDTEKVEQKTNRSPVPGSDTPRITVGSGELDPTSVSVEQGSRVVFVNNAGQKVKIEFERLIDSFSLEPGKTRSVKVDAQVYYTVAPENGGTLSGSIDTE